VQSRYLRKLSQVWCAELTVTVKQVSKVLGWLNVPEQLKVFLCQLIAKLVHIQLQQ